MVYINKLNFYFFNFICMNCFLKQSIQIKLKFKIFSSPFFFEKKEKRESWNVLLIFHFFFPLFFLLFLFEKKNLKEKVENRKKNIYLFLNFFFKENNMDGPLAQLVRALA